MSTIEVENLSEGIKGSGITMLLYGESGIGKSSLLGTMEGKTLVIDVEGGLGVLGKKKSVDRVVIREDLSNVKAVFDALVTAHADYDNICLDSSTELEKFMQIRLAAEGKKSDGMPSLHDYGVAQFKVRGYLRVLRDLKERGVNIVVTALEMPLELDASVDGVVHSRLYPMMSKKLAPEVCGIFDVVAHMEVSSKEGSEGRRFVRLTSSDSCIAKNRFGGVQYWACDAGSTDTLARLFDALRQGESELIT